MASLLDKDIDKKFRRRDVSETFTMARAEHTPVSSTVRKGKAPGGSLYEFPFKERHAPSDNAIADGVEVQSSEVINNEAHKHMLQARIQKGRVVVGVSDVAEKTGDQYAVPRTLLADNVVDGIVLAKENLEVTMLKNGDSRAHIDTDNPMLLRGVTNWIRTANPGDADLPIPTAALAPAGNIVSGKAAAADVTEDDVAGILRTIATTCRGMKNLHVYGTPLMRQRIASFMSYQAEVASTVAVRRFNTDSKGKTIYLTVDKIITDFGMFWLHTHFSLPSGVHALLVDMDNLALRPLQNPNVASLEYRGGSHQRMIEYIVGLEVSNPQAHGKITT